MKIIIDIPDEVYKSVQNGTYCGSLYEELKKAVEPKQGEWIIHADDLYPAESTQECSVCHAEQYINGNDDNFCPKCGASMVKGGDEK